jgi:uncharacterized protein YbcI
MASSHGPLEGEALLSAVAAAMADLHVRYYHRPPTTAIARMMGDDLLACVLGGMYTDVEKTLIEIQRGEIVTSNRSAFQLAVEDRFIAIVESLAGRRVAHFISTHHVGPDLEIELFFLADAA